jgi:hypothetical protein
MPRVCVPSWSREIAGDACNAFGAGDPPGRELYALRGIYRFGGGLTSLWLPRQKRISWIDTNVCPRVVSQSVCLSEKTPKGKGAGTFLSRSENTQGVHRSIHQHEDLLLSNLINLSIR